MKLKSLIIILALVATHLIQAQASTNEVAISADALVSAPVPTNEVTLIAIRTQEVKGVQTVLTMVAQPAARITVGVMKDNFSFFRLIECQMTSPSASSNVLVYGWFLRMMETSRDSSFGLITRGTIKGDLALTEDGNQMTVLYYELPLVGERQMWMQWYSAAEATTLRPTFPDKWSHSSTNKPCVIDKEIQQALGGVLAAEIVEATERRVRVLAEGRYTKGKKRKLEFYPQERRWVLLREDEDFAAEEDK